MKKKEKKILNIDRFNVDINSGLTTSQVNQRIEEGLTNKTKKIKGKTHFQIIFGSFFTLFNVILYVLAAVICMFQLFHPEGIKALPITKYGFLFVILCNALTSIVSQEISKRTVEKMKLIVNPKALVLRDNKQVEIKVEDIVLDDVVYLKSGSEVPCDLIVAEDEIYVNESMLTGESSTIKKTKGDILYSGSYIVAGSIRAIADKIGNQTYIAQVENKISNIKKKKSELTININKIIKILLCFVGPIVLLVGLKIFYVGTTILDPINGKHWVFTLDIVNKCAATIVGMIPIGMILLTTITLAESIVKLFKEKTMVQDLYAIENLSRVDTLCLDKTGTLTTQYYIVDNVLKFKSDINIDAIISNIISNTNDTNATSLALKKHFTSDFKFDVVDKEPFSSKTKMSSITLSDGTKDYSGAPEYILKNKENLNKSNEFASHGLRVIALTNDDEDLGLIVLKDELRKGIRQTLEFFKDLNVDIKIISGDNPLTVKEVSKDAGVINSDLFISMENIPLDEIKNICDKYVIFGRTSPDQKQEIIRCLEEKGKVVGYIGDGVNDTQSLRQADCSVALKSGADSTKAVSDVVLLDDDFSHLPFVLKEGRRVVANIQRSLLLFLTKAFFIGLFSFLTVFSKQGLPIELEAIYIYEFISIALCGVLLSLQNNKVEPIKGSLVKNVLSKSFIYGVFMSFSAILPVILDAIMPTYINNLESVITIFITISGIVILFEVCKPLTRYTAVVFVVGIIFSSLFMMMFPNVFLDGEYLKDLGGFSAQVNKIFANFFDWSLFYSFNSLETWLVIGYLLVSWFVFILIKYIIEFIYSKMPTIKKRIKNLLNKFKINKNNN